MMRDGPWHQRLLILAMGLATAAATSVDAAPESRADDWLFADDFSSGLDGWRFPLGNGHELVETGDPSRGRALALHTAGLQTHALIRGSETWPDVRIQGEVLFPDDEHNYLGFIYRYADAGRRIDFGSLYIKGNGSYAQANPHSDTNVGRLVFPERRAMLTGASAITIGEWQQFVLEVVGAEAHLYVGGSATPQLTLNSGEAARGAFGFKPRHPGGEVRIDNIRVRSIDGFSYRGPAQPDVPYSRDAFVTDWQVLGPLENMSAAIESGRVSPPETLVENGRRTSWRPYPADPRGAVLTGRVTEYRGSRRVAYFHARLSGPPAGAADSSGEAELEISSADPLAVWLNGQFVGFAPAGPAAWWNAGEHADEPPLRWRIDLRPGANDLLVRTVGGTYASGGYYLRVRRGEPSL